MRWTVKGLAIATLALSSTDALANGRFPEAQAIVSVPDDARTLFLRATFGILVSRDGGKRWSWICERALGYDGQWDPPIAATRDGRLWVGLEEGLVSTRDGCDVEQDAELRGHTVKDLTTDARGETLWAITSAPGKKGFVWRRAAGGRFEQLAGLDETNLMTIEVAPSLATRVYVSGQPYGTIRGRIYRSDDGGATLTAAVGPPGDAGVRSAAALDAEGPFFIGAVGADDPSRLVVRHLHGEGSDLLVSKDGGKTFKNVLSMKSAMYGFAKSADHRTMWAGSGLDEHGIYRSEDGGETFTQASKHGVLCLHAAASGEVFTCENAVLGATAIAVSRDRGGTVVPLARFADIAGPVACPVPDARGGACAGSWAETLAQISPRADGGVADAGARRKKDPAAKAAPKPASSSCHCEVAGARVSERSPLGLGSAALAIGMWARLRRGSRTPQRPRRCSTAQQDGCR